MAPYISPTGQQLLNPDRYGERFKIIGPTGAVQTAPSEAYIEATKAPGVLDANIASAQKSAESEYETDKSIEEEMVRQKAMKIRQQYAEETKQWDDPEFQKRQYEAWVQAPQGYRPAKPSIEEWMNAKEGGDWNPVKSLINKASIVSAAPALALTTAMDIPAAISQGRAPQGYEGRTALNAGNRNLVTMQENLRAEPVIAEQKAKKDIFEAQTPKAQEAILGMGMDQKGYVTAEDIKDFKTDSGLRSDDPKTWAKGIVGEMNNALEMGKTFVKGAVDYEKGNDTPDSKALTDFAYISAETALLTGGGASMVLKGAQVIAKGAQRFRILALAREAQVIGKRAPELGKALEKAKDAGTRAAINSRMGKLEEAAGILRDAMVRESRGVKFALATGEALSEEAVQGLMESAVAGAQGSGSQAELSGQAANIVQELSLQAPGMAIHLPKIRKVLEANPGVSKKDFYNKVLPKMLLDDPQMLSDAANHRNVKEIGEAISRIDTPAKYTIDPKREILVDVDRTSPTAETELEYVEQIARDMDANIRYAQTPGYSERVTGSELLGETKDGIISLKGGATKGTVSEEAIHSVQNDIRTSDPHLSAQNDFYAKRAAERVAKLPQGGKVQVMLSQAFGRNIEESPLTGDELISRALMQRAGHKSADQAEDLLGRLVGLPDDFRKAMENRLGKKFVTKRQKGAKESLLTESDRYLTRDEQPTGEFRDGPVPGGNVRAYDPAQQKWYKDRAQGKADYARTREERLQASEDNAMGEAKIRVNREKYANENEEWLRSRENEARFEAAMKNPAPLTAQEYSEMQQERLQTQEDFELNRQTKATKPELMDMEIERLEKKLTGNGRNPVADLRKEAKKTPGENWAWYDHLMTLKEKGETLKSEDTEGERLKFARKYNQDRDDRHTILVDRERFKEMGPDNYVPSPEMYELARRKKIPIFPPEGSRPQPKSKSILPPDDQDATVRASRKKLDTPKKAEPVKEETKDFLPGNPLGIEDWNTDSETTPDAPRPPLLETIATPEFKKAWDESGMEESMRKEFFGDEKPSERDLTLFTQAVRIEQRKLANSLSEKKPAPKAKEDKPLKKKPNSRAQKKVDKWVEKKQDEALKENPPEEKVFKPTKQATPSQKAEKKKPGGYYPGKREGVDPVGKAWDFLKDVGERIDTNFAQMYASIEALEKKNPGAIKRSAYTGFRVLPASVAYQIATKVTPVMDTITRMLTTAGISWEDAEMYAYSLGAIERNDTMFNEKGVKDGSGLSNEDANGILDGIASDPKRMAVLDKVFGKRNGSARGLFQKINDAKLDAMVEAGLMPKSTAEFLRERYKAYIPMKTLEYTPPELVSQARAHAMNLVGFALEKAGMKEKGINLQKRADAVLEKPLGTVAKNDKTPAMDMSVSARKLRVAEGRAEPADYPLSWSLRDAVNGIAKAERSKAQQDFLEFVEATGSDPRFIQVEPGIRQEYVWINAATDEYVTDADAKELGLDEGDEGAEYYRKNVWLDKEDKIVESGYDALKENEILVTRDGYTYKLTANMDNTTAVRAIKAMKQTDLMKLNAILRGMSSFNNFRSGLLTRFNPLFPFTNTPRDIQNAFTQTFIRRGLKMSVRFLANLPRAFKEAARGQMGKDSELFRDYRKHGGPIEFMTDVDVEQIHRKYSEQINDLQRKGLAKATPKQLWNLIKTGASLSNEVTDKAIRLSVYAALTEDIKVPEGLDAKQEAEFIEKYKRNAALLSRDATVDFNSKGNMTPAISAVWLFANPGIQQFRTVMKNFQQDKATTRRAALIYSSAVMAGYALSAYNRMQGDDEETGNNKWDETPAFQKSSKITLITDGGLKALPLMYGSAGFFFVMGEVLEAAVNSQKLNMGDLFELAVKGVSAAMPVQELTPSIAVPYIELKANEDYRGMPIVPQKPFSPYTVPESEKFYRATPAYLKAVARGMNKMTGGDKWTSGAVDVSPEVLQYLLGYMGGAVLGETLRVSRLGQEIANSTEGAGSILSQVSAKNIPVLSKYTGELPEDRATRAIYDVENDMQVIAAKLAETRKLGGEGYDEQWARNAAENMFLPVWSRFKTKASQVRTRKEGGYANQFGEKDAKKIMENKLNLARNWNSWKKNKDTWNKAYSKADERQRRIMEKDFSSKVFKGFNGEGDPGMLPERSNRALRMLED